MRRAASPAGAAPRLALAAALALCCAATAAAARAASFVVEKGSLRIRAPAHIAGAYDTAVGDFGVPLYGGTLGGTVLYNSSNGLGCREFDSPLPAGDLPTVLLVDRGDCFFVEKASYAQRAGAKALIVTDHTEEPLLTMAVPEDRPEVAALVPEITIPVVLVTKARRQLSTEQTAAGERIKSVLQAGGSQAEVEVELDWSDSIAHPDARVEWELWFTAQDGCGQACDSMRAFFPAFKDAAEALEREQHTLFTPHVMTRACSAWSQRSRVRSRLHPRREVLRGDVGTAAVHQEVQRRPAALLLLLLLPPLRPNPLPVESPAVQVVEQNKRHLCAFDALNNTQHEAWRWWDYAAGFAAACTMAAGRFDAGCAEEVMRAAGVDVTAVNACMGPSDADRPHPIMEAQVAAQADEARSGRGRVILLPTVVINADQYRGSLAAPAVLRALCAGFSEGSEPPICLTGGLNVDECAAGTDQCWRDGPEGRLSACVDTFRGYVCRCPPGKRGAGDGRSCADVDECALGIAGCDQLCVNTPGSYRCECRAGYTLHGGQGAPGMCLPNSLSPSRLPAWLLAILVVASVVAVSVAGLFAYRWRLRREMQAEIRSIMREYLPLGEGAAAAAEAAEMRQSLLPQGGRGPFKGGGGGGGGSGARGSGVEAAGQERDEEEGGGSPRRLH
ncbi:hypothetical protein CHLNCDRAFT_144100 [Chlorella variabilis]|uniref:EGF-like domain-containing protein n=1 Tax=Chlorella variabilis TaxID=554065 RepID=E1ZBW6_CHLVA|nr:hypothetical protein CHLNCDRAFT_144100 [Chlorella variabilis]EFN56501.1 hypothetical protein CHLNCDRAFT_144100 [Chlorella variabilis]|eukprot:XP_005848603.1 hypothetical protein CHLNCDRAFT_144100 [Chlorella variabilis]